MPRKIKTKVSTITNTQIMLATVAAFLANGLALAALPVTKVPQPAGSCNAQVIGSGKVCKIKNNVNGYRSFRYTCPNGKTFHVSASCRSVSAMQKIANEACSTRKYCALSPEGQEKNLNQLLLKKEKTVSPGAKGIVRTTPSPGAQNFSDVGFIGRPEENITFYRTADGKSKIKVRYTNRGPADVPVSEQVEGGTVLSVTLLNDRQEPISFSPETFFAPETFLPVIANGQSNETVFTLPDAVVKDMEDKKVHSLKFELKIGKREVGGTGAFDPEISNNTLIFEVPSSPFPVQEEG